MNHNYAMDGLLEDVGAMFERGKDQLLNQAQAALPNILTGIVGDLGRQIAGHPEAQQVAADLAYKQAADSLAKEILETKNNAAALISDANKKLGEATAFAGTLVQKHKTTLMYAGIGIAVVLVAFVALKPKRKTV